MYTLKILDEWIKLHNEDKESPFKIEKRHRTTGKKENPDKSSK